MNRFTESIVEDAALEWFEGLGYSVAHGPDIARDGESPERASYDQVVLIERLQSALTNINPAIPTEAIEDAVKKITTTESPTLIQNNERLHRLLTDGVDVEYRRDDGSLKGDKVRLLDFTDPDNNDWLAVNQFTVQEPRGQARRPDVVIFVNGIPLAVIELKNPDISILSEEFLAEVAGLPQKNLAVEMLRKLLNDEIKHRSRRNVVEARSFKEMLEAAIRKYENRAIETAQIIQELIKLAKEMREASKRGERLKLSDDELAFYDALADNESAVEVLGDKTLRDIAREVAAKIRQSASIDWTIKETVRASMRAMVKRLLRKYGYPPDKQEAATKLVLEQAELLCLTIAA